MQGESFIKTMHYAIKMEDKPDYSKPFRVLILEDSREAYGSKGSLTGQYGVCLGMYEVPHDLSVPADLSRRVLDFDGEGLARKLSGSVKRGKSGSDLEDEVDLVNPLLLSDVGDYIWGIQCYFAASQDLVGIPADLWLQIPDLYRGILREEFESRRRRN